MQYCQLFLLNVSHVFRLFGFFNTLLSFSLAKMKESEAGVSHDNNDDDSDNPPDELVKIAEEPKEKWDCESILSECFVISLV